MDAGGNTALAIQVARLESSSDIFFVANRAASSVDKICSFLEMPQEICID